jgi:hypothetical protein
MHRILYWLVFVGLGLFATSTVAVLAQEASEIPDVTIRISAEGITAPQDIAEGAVHIIFENTTDAPVAPSIARLNEGVTADDLGAAYAKEDPMASLPLASDLGGTMVMPGTTAEVTFVFTPGNYILHNIFGGDELLPFTVADGEGEGAAAPEADLEIGLVDFAFIAPISIAAGSHVLHLDDNGNQFHMMLVFRIDDSMTVHELNQHLLEESDSDELPKGVEQVAIWFPMSAGEQAWLTLDLEPGTYLIICPLPDITGSGHTHDQLGMRQTLIVTESMSPADGTPESTPASAALTGAWKVMATKEDLLRVAPGFPQDFLCDNAGTFVWNFNADGTFTIDQTALEGCPSPAQTHIESTWSSEGDLVTFAKGTPDEEVYQWSVDGDRLTFEYRSGNCIPCKATNTANPWQRLSN